MRKKIFMFFILLIIMLIIGTYPIAFKSKSNTRNANTLKVYLLGTNESFDKRMDAVINKYQATYKDMKIEKVMFNPNTDDGINGYVKKMLTDTLAGDGPDILLLDSNSTRKLEKSDMLLDLKPFIQKDKDFKSEDYNMKVINSGLYKGEQVIMPLDYYMNQYITTDKLLKDNNITLDANCSQKDFMSSLDKYISLTANDKNKFLFATPMSLEDFLANSDEDFIDYDNKKTFFDKPSFKEIIGNYKKIYNASRKRSDLQGISGMDGFEGLKDGNILFSNDPLDMRGTFFEYESLINQVIKENQVINSMPSYKGGDKVIPIVGSSLAISKDSKNPEASYNFIKTAISEDIESSHNLPQCIPVNRKAAKDLENQYLTNEVNVQYKYSKNITVVNKPLSDNFKNYYNRILDNTSDAKITNSEIENIMLECLTPYFDDKASIESCINVLENKIYLYLNE